MKRGLKMLYAAQIDAKKKQMMKEEEETKKESKEGGANEIDLSHLELSLNPNTSSKKETEQQQQYKHLCKSLMNIYNVLLSKKTLKSQHLFAFIDITYQSFLKLCVSLFDEKGGRARAKWFVTKKMMIKPHEFIKKRKEFNIQQQLFDIKLQILLLLEYGVINFKDGNLVDPSAISKFFEAFLQKLEIKDDKESFNEFVACIINRYAPKLPKTFAQYYENKEEEVPKSISTYLDNKMHRELHPTLAMDPVAKQTAHKGISQSPPIPEPSRQRRRRKRRYSEIVTKESQPGRETKRAKKMKTQRTSKNSKSKLQNVIITPSIATKTNPNAKLVSNTSRRTLNRSQRGGAIRSSKRPLRLVLGDKTNNDTHKKRKIEKQKKKKKAALSKAATAFQSNTHSNQQITASAMKKRSTQWNEHQRLHKSRVSHRRSRRAKKNQKSKKTPPLKRLFTQSQPDLQHQLIPPPQTLSRTKSFGNLPRTQAMDQDNEENERGQSLPTHEMNSNSNNSLDSQATTQSVSPLLPQFTRSQSLGQLQFDGFGGETFQFQSKQKEMSKEIHCAMEDGHDWMKKNDEIPPANMMAQNVFIHQAIKPQNSCSIPATPNVMMKKAQTCFGFGYNADVIFGSGNSNRGNKRNSLIPETPDTVNGNEGTGASNMKSHCKINLRQAMRFHEDFDNIQQNLLHHL